MSFVVMVYAQPRFDCISSTVNGNDISGVAYQYFSTDNSYTALKALVMLFSVFQRPLPYPKSNSFRTEPAQSSCRLHRRRYKGSQAKASLLAYQFITVRSGGAVGSLADNFY